MDEKTIYSQIARARTLRGLTRTQLAEVLGVHYQTVGYLERRESAPSIALALKMSEVLECSVEDLFSLKPLQKEHAAKFRGH